MGSVFCPRRVLVGTKDGSVDMMGFPVQVTGGIGLFLHGGEDAVPDSGLPPAVEPGRPVEGGPEHTGKSGQGTPMRKIHKMPLMIGRSSFRGRPPLLLLIGRYGGSNG